MASLRFGREDSNDLCVRDPSVSRCRTIIGNLKIITAIEDPPVIIRILTHLGLPTHALPHASAQRVDLFQTI
jgi:hypothetical protein